MGERSFPNDLPDQSENNGLGEEWYRFHGPAELARRADIALGTAVVRPSVRSIIGPGGTASVEPRTMQVILALADAQGVVVTREDLIQRCWDGQIVGEDAVYRTIGEVRRLARDIGDNSFSVDNIPKTGYRLLVGDVPYTTSEDARPAGTGGISRRTVVGIAAAAGVAIAGGLAGRAYFAGRTDPRAADLIARGAQALRDELPDGIPQAIRLLKEAVRIEPGSAQAWGYLALAWRNAAEHGSSDQTAAAVAACHAAARRALALDPSNGNAHAALARLWPIFGDWSGAEQRLRAVLKIAPDNVVAISALGTLLQSVGRVSESARYSSRAAELDPMSPIYQFRKTFGLWCIGRLEEADRTIDRALQLWPRHPTIWGTRVLLFALTDRPHAALVMIDDSQGQPPAMPEAELAYWRGALKALVTRAPADIEAVMASTLAAIARGPNGAPRGVCLATKLGDLDAAFAMTDAYLLRRGPHVGVLRSGPDRFAVSDRRWQMTMMLFIPATAPMRADPRFMALCRDMGMVDYWRSSGTRPDFLAALT